MNKLLTIVVPVYKVEPYINKCLDSCILADEKLMEQLEVIIVNDGTPDNSAEMSREYVKRYPKTFRQIDKENGGHGSAWNVGLKEATGKYLRFLDSDDWLSNLDTLIEKLQNTNADIVLSDFMKCYANENREERRYALETTNSPITIDIKFLTECKNNYELINFWHSTYKTEILKPLFPLFAEHVMYDDSILFFSPIIFGRTYEAISIPVYNYLLGRDGQSVNKKVQQKNVKSYICCMQKMEDIRRKCSEFLLPDDYIGYIDSTISVFVHYFFHLLIFLPYRQSKEQMAYVNNKYPFTKCKKPKYVTQYQKLPFFIYYLLQHLRAIKNKHYV